MRPLHWNLALACLALFTAQAGAVDLTRIDRSLRREPVYQSKDPQYCLLVFGPEARVRVWVVLDGDTLYLDRSGNGDLTGPGDRIGPRVVPSRPGQWPDAEVVLREFALRRPVMGSGVPAGEPIFPVLPRVTSLRVVQSVPRDVARDEAEARYRREQPLVVEVASLGEYGQRAEVAFAARSQDAPILHFGGPLRVTLVDDEEPLELRLGETCWLTARLTTPGLGAAVCTYEVPGLPKSRHPVAEVECPPRRPGESPVRFRTELTEPC